MIRVIGSSFSFYSAAFEPDTIEIIEDYSALQTMDLPLTLVYKLCPSESELDLSSSSLSSAAALPSTTTLSQFNFIHPRHRVVILTLLDKIRQILLRQ